MELEEMEVEEMAEGIPPVGGCGHLAGVFDISSTSTSLSTNLAQRCRAKKIIVVFHNNCLKFSPQKGQNRPKWVKMLSKLLRHSQKGAKRDQKGARRLKRGQNSSKVGPKAPKVLQMGSKWARRPLTGSKWPSTGQNRLQLAQNRPKWPFNWVKMAFN